MATVDAASRPRNVPGDAVSDRAGACGRDSVEAMTPNHHVQIYTMPMKQLLTLLETTADDSRRTTRPRPRLEMTPAAGTQMPEPEYIRY